MKTKIMLLAIGTALLFTAYGQVQSSSTEMTVPPTPTVQEEAQQPQPTPEPTTTAQEPDTVPITTQEQPQKENTRQAENALQTTNPPEPVKEPTPLKDIVYAHTREECEEKLKVLIVEMKSEIAEAKRLMDEGKGNGSPPEEKRVKRGKR